MALQALTHGHRSRLPRSAALRAMERRLHGSTSVPARKPWLRRVPPMPLDTPTPDGVLELFRDEITPREADVGGEYDEAALAGNEVAWASPFPGVETLTLPGGPTLMRVTYKRVIRGAYDEGDRVRHELRQLRNDVRAATPSDAQAEFMRPRLTHVDRP